MGIDELQPLLEKSFLEVGFKSLKIQQIAEKIGCPQGYRAVGMANNKNPIAIIVPCHRVIGQNKKLVGYAGGIDIKEKLLKLEEKYAGS